MDIFVYLIPLLSLLVGVYLVMLGFWELRIAENRSRYINYMFTGLFLMLFVTPILYLIVRILNLRFVF